MSNDFKCNSCDQSFQSKGKRRLHVGKMHQASCRIGEMIVNRIDSVFKCPKCGKKFDNPNYLQKHFKTHSDDNINGQSVLPNGQSVLPSYEGPKYSNAIHETVHMKAAGLNYNSVFGLLICTQCNRGITKSIVSISNHLQAHKVSKKLVGYTNEFLSSKIYEHVSLHPATEILPEKLISQPIEGLSLVQGLYCNCLLYTSPSPRD